MAMKPCGECLREIAGDADPCPHCGKKMPHGVPPWRYLLATILFMMAFTFTARSGCGRVRADPPKWESEVNAESCAASYQERLADVRGARKEHLAYMAEHERLAVWFNEHCRWLSELERVVRRLDDPMAFVCDTKNGRPKGLTGEAVAPYIVPTAIVNHMEWSHSDVICEQHDVAAGRPSLNLHEPATDEERAPAAMNAYTVKLLEALCWEMPGKECDAARSAIAALRAKQALSTP